MSGDIISGQEKTPPMNTNMQHPRVLKWYGYKRFAGKKEPMKEEVNLIGGVNIALQVQTKFFDKKTQTVKYGRGYVPVPKGREDAFLQVYGSLMEHCPAELHVNEIIQQDKPCKPNFDFDGNTGLPSCFVDRDDFRSKVEVALTNIFKKTYDVELCASDFAWVYTEYPLKFSAHLIINHYDADGSLVVFPTHHPTMLHDGVKGLCSLLLKEMPELADTPDAKGITDTSIYSKDREMRLPGSCKAPKPTDENWSPRTAYIATEHTLKDCMISYLPEKVRVLDLPIAEKKPSKSKKVVRASGRLQGDITLSEAAERMLELVRKQHPTAFFEPASADEDILDPEKGCRMNYDHSTDEKCWSGCHHTACNFNAYYRGDDAFVYCYNCRKNWHVGRMYNQFEHDDDVVVDMRFLERKQDLGSIAEETDVYKFNVMLNQLMKEQVRVLGIQSPMGSGKTTLLKHLTDEQDAAGQKKVCVVTYRQTLSDNMLEELESRGFVNYLNFKGDGVETIETENGPMEVQRAKEFWQHDKVIVQFDSIKMVCRDSRVLQKFDMVILDEIESLLSHSTAKTMKEKQGEIFNTFVDLVSTSGKTIVMDAFLGDETRAFFSTLGLSMRVVRNAWRGAQRTFKFSGDKSKWIDRVADSIRSGKNIVVPCMSSSMCNDLRANLLEKTDLTSNDILVIEGKSDDALKRRVRYVNDDWVKYRTVIYSPTVEAGVNFDREHFDKMFCYICAMSTTPLAFAQMTGRVRKLRDLEVDCVTSKLTTISEDAAVTPSDMVDYFRWRDNVKFDDENIDWNYGRMKLTSGEYARMPRSDALMVVASHNWARTINGQRRFMSELLSMLQFAGHKFVIGSWAGSHKAPPGQKKEILLNSADIEHAQAQEYLMRRCANIATREEKCALERYFYRTAWGVKAIDEAFINAHGVDAEATQLNVCMAMLRGRGRAHNAGIQSQTGRTVVDLNDPSQSKANVLAEILDVLGVVNPFDRDASYPLTEDVLDRLRQCRAIRTYRDNDKLFDIERDGTPNFSEVGSITKTLEALFMRAGLYCDSVGKRKRVNGKLARVYEVTFGSDKVMKKEHPAVDINGRMADLVKLRLAKGDCVKPDVEQFLATRQLQYYADEAEGYMFIDD